MHLEIGSNDGLDLDAGYGGEGKRMDSAPHGNQKSIQKRGKDSLKVPAHLCQGWCLASQ